MSEQTRLPLPDGAGGTTDVIMDRSLSLVPPNHRANGFAAAGILSAAMASGLPTFVSSGNGVKDPLAWDSLAARTRQVRVDPVLAANRDPFLLEASLHVAKKPTTEDTLPDLSNIQLLSSPPASGEPQDTAAMLIPYGLSARPEMPVVGRGFAVEEPVLPPLQGRPLAEEQPTVANNLGVGSKNPDVPIIASLVAPPSSLSQTAIGHLGGTAEAVATLGRLQSVSARQNEETLSGETPPVVVAALSDILKPSILPLGATIDRPEPKELGVAENAGVSMKNGFAPVSAEDVSTIIPVIQQKLGTDGDTGVDKLSSAGTGSSLHTVQAEEIPDLLPSVPILNFPKNSSPGFSDTGVIIEVPVGVKAPEQQSPVADKPIAPSETVSPPENALGTVISEQDYRDGFVLWAKDMLARNIKEVGVNAGPPSKLFMDGKSGKDYPWCVAAATAGDMALGIPFDTKYKGVESNGRMWYTPYLVDALKNEPGSAVYPAKDFLTGDHLKGKIGVGDYVMYYYPKKNDAADASHHTARIIEIGEDGYWTADGNWSNRYMRVFHPWDKNDHLKYVGTRFASVTARVTHAPGTPEPTLSTADKGQKPVIPGLDTGSGAKIPIIKIGGGLPGFTAGDPADAPDAPASGDKTPGIPVIVVTSPAPPDSTEPPSRDAGSPTIVTLLPVSGGGSGFGADGEETVLPPTTTSPPAVNNPEPVQPTAPAPAPKENLPDSHGVRLEAFQHSVITQESGGNPEIVNDDSGAAGLFQYMDKTWNMRGGYNKASQAPPTFQYSEASKDMQQLYTQFKKAYPNLSEDEVWFHVAAGWYAGPNWKKNGVNIYEKQGKYPSVADYAEEVVERAKDYLADPDSMPKVAGLSAADNDLRI